MESRAVTRYVRVAPRKVRLVVDMIRGQRVERALGILEFTTKGAAKLVAKTVKSAVANAENNQNVDVDRLYVKRAFVDEGPTLKRILHRAHGRATPLQKKTSHITIVVDEQEKRGD